MPYAYVLSLPYALCLRAVSALCLMPTCCLCLMPYADLLSLPYALCRLADTLCLPGPLVARRRVQVLFRGGPLAAPSASVFVLLY
jgi:hypothetical protein